MDGFVRACSKGDIPEHGMKECIVGEKTILFVSSRGAIHAVDPLCTHEDCAFAESGALEGDLLICGCHGASFEFPTGSVRSLPATVDLKTYPVKVHGHDVFIDLR